jgi:hypothetical protein
MILNNNNEPSAEQIHLALDRALSIFEDPVKQTLLFYMKEKDPSFYRSPSLEKMQNAFNELLGLGGELIMRQVKENLEQIRKGALDPVPSS